MPPNPIQQQIREKRDKEILKLYPNLTMEEIGKRYKIKSRDTTVRYFPIPYQEKETLKILLFLKPCNY